MQFLESTSSVANKNTRNLDKPINAVQNELFWLCFGFGRHALFT